MKPFVLLQSRPEPEAAQNEYEAFVQFGGLEPHELKRIAMDRGELGRLNLDDYAGIIIGGGPSNVSDPIEKKSAAQRAFEPVLFELVREAVRRDFPLLGACLGIGMVGQAMGGVISRRYPEPVGPVTITLEPDAIHDPLLAGLPNRFDAFVGHKECCEELPQGAKLLASSPTCPVQMFKMGSNVYVTQFHPELDAHGLALRIGVYKHAGYFKPEDAEPLIAMAHQANVTEPVKILRRFIDRYRGN